MLEYLLILLDWVFGPLLGSAVTEICNRVRFNEREHRIVMAWNSELMNENTAPGIVNGYIYS